MPRPASSSATRSRSRTTRARLSRARGRRSRSRAATTRPFNPASAIATATRSPTASSTRATSGASATAKIDTSAPTPAPSLAYGSFSNAALVGGIVYYRPGAASGQFAVTGSGSADPESAISGYNFPAASGGWSRSIVGTTATYSHTGSPTDPVEPQNVTAANNAGLASAATTFTVTPDSSVPTGQSVALSGGPYYTSLSVALTPTDGSDTGSGLDTSTRVYERDTGTLSNGTCSGFPGTWGTTVSNPDTSVVSGNCYRYRLKISDRVGNQSAASSASADAKVDTLGTHDPTFTYGSFSNAALTGGVVYYRPGAASGQFAVTPSLDRRPVGDLGLHVPRGGRRLVAVDRRHDGDLQPHRQPDRSCRAEQRHRTEQRRAELDATSFTVTPDSSLPSSAIQCNGGACSAGWYTSSPVSVTLSANDTGSGVSQIKYTTDGSDPTSATAWSMRAPSMSRSTTTVKYRAWDNVGNAEAVQTQLIQIDTYGTVGCRPSSFSALTNAVATGSPSTSGPASPAASPSPPRRPTASPASPPMPSRRSAPAGAEARRARATPTASQTRPRPRRAEQLDGDEQRRADLEPGLVHGHRRWDRSGQLDPLQRRSLLCRLEHGHGLGQPLGHRGRVGPPGDPLHDRRHGPEPGQRHGLHRSVQRPRHDDRQVPRLRPGRKRRGGRLAARPDRPERADRPVAHA